VEVGVPNADFWTSSWTGNRSTTSSVLVTKLRLWVAGRPTLSKSTFNSFSLRSGRVPLSVCAECGDLGCGAITALVERTPDGFVWRDFAFENNYDGTMTDMDSYRAIGPFMFNKTEYWQVLNERAVTLSAT
jgi:hypothetical protein